jgi:hypothetical protein
MKGTEHLRLQLWKATLKAKEALEAAQKLGQERQEAGKKLQVVSQVKLAFDCNLSLWWSTVRRTGVGDGLQHAHAHNIAYSNRPDQFRIAA